MQVCINWLRWVHVYFETGVCVTILLFFPLIAFHTVHGTIHAHIHMYVYLEINEYLYLPFAPFFNMYIIHNVHEDPIYMCIHVGYDFKAIYSCTCIYAQTKSTLNEFN